MGGGTGGGSPDPSDQGGSLISVKGHLESSRIASGSVITVPRLVPLSGAGGAADGPPPEVSSGEWFQLRPRPRGSLGALVPEAVSVEAAKATLGPGEVLVAVQAVGINFRDVLNVSAAMRRVVLHCSIWLILIICVWAWGIFSQPSSLHETHSRLFVQINQQSIPTFLSGRRCSACIRETRGSRDPTAPASSSP